MALAAICKHKQTLQTELESCLYLLLYILRKGSAIWQCQTLDSDDNETKRHGLFCTKWGREKVLKGIPEVLHKRLHALIDLFYCQEGYLVAPTLSVDEFVSVLECLENPIYFCPQIGIFPFYMSV